VVLDLKREHQPELIGFSTAEIIAHAVITEPKSFARDSPPAKLATGAIPPNFIRYFLAVLLRVVFPA